MASTPAQLLARFAWPVPLTKTKVLLNLGLWDEKAGPSLRGVIR